MASRTVRYVCQTNKQLFISTPTICGRFRLSQFAGPIALQTAVRTDCRLEVFQFRFSDVDGSCYSADQRFLKSFAGLPLDENNDLIVAPTFLVLKLERTIGSGGELDNVAR